MIGSDSVDSVVGSAAMGIVVSEAALADKRGLSLLRPMTTASNGFFLAISTPRSHNHFYDLYNTAKNLDDWYVSYLTIEDTKHIPIERIEKDINSGIISRELAQQEYWCFPAGQQVLMSNGLKNIEDVNINEMVLSHSGRFRTVKKLYAREFSGKLITINTYGSCEPIVCTENHPIRVYNTSSQSYSWKEAKNITKDDRLVFPKKHIKNNTKVISYDLCMIMAWYITEGSSSKNAVSFTLGSDKDKNRVINILNNLGFESNVLIDRNGVSNIYVYNTSFVDFLKVNCGSISYDKKIPFDLISGHEEDFFYEVIAGDGCRGIRNGHERISYSTVSKGLVYQMQLLAHSLVGKSYASGVQIRKENNCIIEGRRVNCRESYTLNVYTPNPGKNKPAAFLLRAKNCIAAKINNITSKQYDGTVYNLGIQYDESYVVGGRAVHNCSWSSVNSGSYFAKTLDLMVANNQITNVPFDPSLSTYCFVDLGMSDMFTMIWIQLTSTAIHIIDFYESHSEPLSHYVNIIKDKPYGHTEMWIPHDGRVRELATGVSRYETIQSLNIDVSIVDRLPISEGIEAIRSALPKTYIDKNKCKKLINSIENYSREFDERLNVYKDRPKHDIHCHRIDALRYGLSTYKKLSNDSSPEELDARYRKAIYGDISQSLNNDFF